jgi:hypothetical protein
MAHYLENQPLAQIKFLWLVPHKGILTWDNLWKQGFMGPLFSLICLQHEETLDNC